MPAWRCFDFPHYKADTHFREEGTFPIHTYLKESIKSIKFGPPTKEQRARMKALYSGDAPPYDCKMNSEVERLVEELIGRVADKWTMLILEVLVENGELRFTRVGKLVGGISQKMLTQTLRQMERDGLLTRKVHPVVPPRVEYKISDLGLTLSAAFCSVWIWSAENLKKVEAARRKFDQKLQKKRIPSSATSV